MKRIINWLTNLFSTKNITSSRIKKRPLSDYEFNEIKIGQQKKLDSILDKISKSGYSSLSVHEKNFLKNLSK